MRILVVDDEARQRELLTEYFNKNGHRARAAENGQHALELLNDEGAESAFVDMRMPKMDGMAFIQKSMELYPDLAIVVMTAYGTIESAVKAMKAGAFDYLLKPIDLEHIQLILAKIEEKQRLISENRLLKRKLEQVDMQTGMIGESDDHEKSSWPKFPESRNRTPQF